MLRPEPTRIELDQEDIQLFDDFQQQQKQPTEVCSEKTPQVKDKEEKKRKTKAERLGLVRHK